MEGNELGLHKIERTFNKKIEETKAKIYNGSLRSGNKIEYEGTLIIVGDVNAGAEVIAGEHVMVVGALRGLAHAGANGNKEAMIAASEINAPQVRIADIVKEIERDEDEDDYRTTKRKAYIRGDMIVLE